MLEGLGLFVWGCVGAVLAEVVSARAMWTHERKRWNKEKKRLAFWGFSIAFTLAGGVIALAHESSDASLTKWLAVNVGFTWPLLLRRGAGALPETDYKAG